VPIHHKLDLLENAVDSLNESLRRYQEGLDGNHRAYKFAILHFSHFIELLLKYYVTQAHPLLIYKNPFSKKVDSERTIGLWDAVQFLKNEGKDFDAAFANDLKWMKDIRNNIEHHKFTMEVAEVRRVIGRLTQAVVNFSEKHAELDIYDHIDTDTFKVFEALADEHRAAVANAQKEAEENTPDGEIYECEICFGEKTVILRDNSYDCLLCGESDPIIECVVCTETYRMSECQIWNDDHAPHIDYACDYCADRIANM